MSLEQKAPCNSGRKIPPPPFQEVSIGKRNSRKRVIHLKGTCTKTSEEPNFVFMTAKGLDHLSLYRGVLQNVDDLRLSHLPPPLEDNKRQQTTMFSLSFDPVMGRPIVLEVIRRMCSLADGRLLLLHTFNSRRPTFGTTLSRPTMSFH